MTTVDLEQQRLLIGGSWMPASGGGTFERNDPYSVNASTVHDEPQMPFGGVKASGWAASAAALRSRSSPSCAG